jgi:uncharacterized membrane protein
VTEARLRGVALVLSVLGIGVAGYLTFIHFFGLEAVCLGGGGGCERVQSSDQSKLLGIPVAVLGLGAYLVLTAANLARTETARIVAALTALVGFGFSAYLTYQSIAVIDATCQWCLASAGLMTGLAVVCVARLLRAEVHA